MFHAKIFSNTTAFYIRNDLLNLNRILQACNATSQERQVQEKGSYGHCQIIITKPIIRAFIKQIIYLTD